VDFSKMGFTAGVSARDLWLGKDLGKLGGRYSAVIPGHGVLFLKVSQ
jgi:alpha-galactosidase